MKAKMRPLHLPDCPYIGLAQFDAEQSLLFVGRENEIDACASIISQSDTRILMLHGRTGCGKSSFLRAGLIPALETNGFGYAFLRTATADGTANGHPVFIRCGGDPLSSLANELFGFVSNPVVLNTARGATPFDLTTAKLGCVDSSTFVEKCRSPERLIDVLSIISGTLVHSLVLVMDQMEEVLTLNSGEDDVPKARFFTFLKLFNNTNHRIKLVLSLRKDHSGEFIGLSQLDDSARAEFKVYLLPELTKEQVRAAVLLPTSDRKESDDGPPSLKYRFSYADGVVERLVEDLFMQSEQGGVLPVMQITCRELYETVRQGAEPWVITHDLYNKTPIKVSISRHIEKAMQAPLSTSGLSPEKARIEARNWRKVLRVLIRYENDGRVSSRFLSREALYERAQEQELPAFERMLEHLAQPEVLVLRRISVVGTSGPDDKMYGLGHDVIGLSLHSLALEDDAKERSEQRRARNRRRNVAIWVVAGISILLVPLIYIYMDQKYVRKKVKIHLEAAEALYSNDVEKTAIELKKADGDAGELLAVFHKPILARLSKTNEAFKSALPVAKLEMNSLGQDGVVGSYGFLDSEPGVVLVDAATGVHISRFDKSANAFSNATYRLPANYMVPENVSVEFTNAFQGRNLLLLSYSELVGDSLQRRFDLFIVAEDETNVIGPYSGEVLLRKFNVIHSRNTGERIKRLSKARVSGVAIYRETVVLVVDINEGKFVVSLVLNSDPKTDYFSPVTKRAMEVSARREVVNVTVPAEDMQQIVGGRLFSAEYLKES